MFAMKTIKIADPEVIYSDVKEYKLLNLDKLIRDKNDFINFAQTLGTLYEWSFGVVNELKVNPEANNYLYTEEAVPFHWDGAFAQVPYLLLFHCVHSAEGNQQGGETLFTDTQAIINYLTPEEKALLDTITVKYETEKIAHYGGCITQKIIDYHPYTQTAVLRFAEAVFSAKNPVKRTISKENAKVRQLINKLDQLLYHPDFCYRHTWKTGDLVIADNHALLHGRAALKGNHKRHIRRIQIL